MANRWLTIMVAVAVVTLVGCATPGSGTDNGAAAGTATHNGQIFATRDISDTYAYPPGSQPGSGRVGSGPTDLDGSNQNVVYFDFDSATVRSDSLPVIEAQVRFLTRNPNAAVILEGHTDERGTREYNIGLGDRRANSVRQLLIASGVSPRQLQTVSYGEERPAALGRDESSYARNRRVEFSY